MEWIDHIVSRPVVIALACIGALLTLVGNDSLARRIQLPPRFARISLVAGYALMWTSVALFIAAGFIVR